MMKSHAAQAVFVPLSGGRVSPPSAGGRILWLNAQMPSAGFARDDFFPADAVIDLQQDFRVDALPLIRGGHDVRAHWDDDAGGYDMVLVCGRKQRAEMVGLLARAVSLLAAGGVLIIAADNDAGGRRLAQDAAALGLELAQDSKYHCRILYGAVHDYDRAAVDAALRAAEPVQIDIDGAPEWTQAGIFGWEKRDRGTALLLSHLPEKMRGVAADLGCGGGVIAGHLARHYPALREIYALDADARAVAMAQRNVVDARVRFDWRAIGAEDMGVPSCDVVVMNPPFHAGKVMDVSAGVAFIAAAAHILRAGGRLWMVANAHLPYETALRAGFREVRKVAEEQGFKIYECVK